MSFQRYVQEQKTIEQQQVARMRSLRKARGTTEAAASAVVIPNYEEFNMNHEGRDRRSGDLQENDPVDRIPRLAAPMGLRTLRERAARSQRDEDDKLSAHENLLQHSRTDQAESDVAAVDQLTAEGGAERIPPSAAALSKTTRQFRLSGV